MKIDYRPILAFVIASLISLVILTALFSCSAKYHLSRYQSKGGVCGQVDTVKVLDSIPYVINDTVVYRYFYKDSLYVVNDRVVPQTRYEIRTDYKIHRDTIKLKETIVKEQTKVEKSENRKSLIWLAMGLIGLVAIYLIKRT